MGRKIQFFDHRPPSPRTDSIKHRLHTKWEFYPELIEGKGLVGGKVEIMIYDNLFL